MNPHVALDAPDVLQPPHEQADHRVRLAPDLALEERDVVIVHEAGCPQVCVAAHPQLDA